jgi:hypothetical protein
MHYVYMLFHVIIQIMYFKQQIHSCVLHKLQNVNNQWKLYNN